MVTESQRNDFYEARRTADLPLAVNDLVIVIRGEKRGSTASVISLESSLPNPNYLIEFPDGNSDVVALSNLKLIRCLLSRTIQHNGEDYFIGIYDEQDSVSLVVSEQTGGDASILLSAQDVDQVVETLRKWRSNR